MVDEQKRWAPPKEVQRVYDIPNTTFWRLVRKGVIKVKRHGRFVRVPLDQPFLSDDGRAA